LSPWPFINQIEISAIEGDLLDQDFLAIKVGDVNYSADVSGLQTAEIREANPLDLVVENRFVETGEEFTVIMSLPNAESLYGFQFEILHESLELKDLQSTMPWHSSNARSENTSTVFSWNDNRAISGEEFLIEITFIAERDGQIRDMLSVNQTGKMNAEAYQGEILTLHDLDLAFTETKSPFAVGQNLPNPFSRITTIDIQIPEASDIRVSVFDVTGKKVYGDILSLPKGKQTLQLNSEDINGDGLLYYHIQYGDQLEVRKMILLK